MRRVSQVTIPFGLDRTRTALGAIFWNAYPGVTRPPPMLLSRALP